MTEARVNLRKKTQTNRQQAEDCVALLNDFCQQQGYTFVIYGENTLCLEKVDRIGQ